MTNAIISLRQAPLTEDRRCSHQPGCPVAHAPDRIAARLIVRHPEQGWSMLCNLVVPSGNGGQLPPHGRAVSPATARPAAAA
jgi:hypothetical protein